jgi:hypothetical protein
MRGVSGDQRAATRYRVRLWMVTSMAVAATTVGLLTVLNTQIHPPALLLAIACGVVGHALVQLWARHSEWPPLSTRFPRRVMTTGGFRPRASESDDTPAGRSGS